MNYGNVSRGDAYSQRGSARQGRGSLRPDASSFTTDFGESRENRLPSPQTSASVKSNPHLFITNRKVEKVAGSETLFKFSASASPGNPVRYCRRSGTSDESFTEITSEEFKTETAKAPTKLFFIHGYFNSPKDAFKRADALQELLGNSVSVTPIIWPSHNTGSEYSADQKNAVISGSELSSVMEKIHSWQTNNDYKEVNILAHSMGNLVLKVTLDKTPSKNRPEFKNTFMFAADIHDRVFEIRKRLGPIKWALRLNPKPSNYTGHIISDQSEAVSVYHASDDAALGFSELVNFFHTGHPKDAPKQLRTHHRFRDRLGENGPDQMGKDYIDDQNIFSIDCNSFNKKYDGGHFGKGHTYFLEDSNKNPGRAFLDMQYALDHKRDPSTMRKRKATLKEGQDPAMFFKKPA